MRRLLRCALIVLLLPIVRDTVTCVLCFLAIDRSGPVPDVAAIVAERTP